MTTTNWTGDAGTTNFNTAGNWDNGVPVAGVDAIIAGTAMAPLTVMFSSGTTTAQTLTTTFTTLDMEAGTLRLTLASALDALTMSGGTLDFANGGTGSTASTFSGPVTMTAGTLEVDAGTLTLNGTNALAGLITGRGSIVTVGSTAVDSLVVGGGATLDNQGIETLTAGTLTLGYSGEIYAPAMVNEAGAIFEFLGDGDIAVAGYSATITNAGLFEKTGGVDSTIAARFVNTGTIDIAAGTLHFTGAASTYSGEIEGTGTADFDASSQTWEPGLTLDVQNVRVSTPITLATNLTYGGALDASNSQLNLSNHTLTLTAAANLSNTLVTNGGTLVTQQTQSVDSLVVGDGAILDNQGIETLTAGTLTLGYSGEIYVPALINEASAKFEFLGDGDIAVAGYSATITNAGLFEKTAGTGVSDIGTTFSNTGTVTVSSGTLEFSGASLTSSGSITVDDGSVDIHTTTFTSTGGIIIGNGGTVEINPATAANITYDDPAHLILDNPMTYTGTLSGLTTGDTLQLDRENIASAGISGTTLTVNLTGGGTLTYHTGPNLNGTTFSLGEGTDGYANDLLTVLCFLAGTLIATPAGETPVERLAVGDMVRTASGAVRPIAWIGQGRVLATPGRRTAATPVVVSRAALGPNVPHHDLRVTKGHSFHLDDVLIPVEFLVNHRTIYWDDRAREVVLYHVELETHDVLLANGAAAESYRDDGNRWLFQNANSGWDQPPKPPCAPVLTGGPEVDAVWRRLVNLAGPRLGLPMTDDPDLHLLVNGRRIDAAWVCDMVHNFRLPARPNTVRIVSRAGVPQELGTARDSRTLGVALRQLIVSQGELTHRVEAASALLTKGFHEYEPSDAIRWTNGDAMIPARLFDDDDSPIELALCLGGGTSYAADDDLHRAA